MQALEIMQVQMLLTELFLQHYLDFLQHYVDYLDSENHMKFHYELYSPRKTTKSPQQVYLKHLMKKNTVKAYAEL